MADREFINAIANYGGIAFISDWIVQRSAEVPTMHYKGKSVGYPRFLEVRSTQELLITNHLLIRMNTSHWQFMNIKKSEIEKSYMF
jgi:hypothetical protein